MLRKAIRVVIYVLLAGLVGLVVCSWVLYRMTPSWYKPATAMTEEQMVEASNRLVGQLSDLNTKILQEDSAVTWQLNETQLNEYLASAIHTSGQSLPGGLREMMIALEPGRLILAGRHESFGDRVISVHLSMALVDGKLKSAVQSVQVGTLPLPQQFVEDQLAEIALQLEQAIERGRSAADDDPVREKLLEVAPLLLSALRSEALPCEFVWKLGQAERPVRIEDLAIGGDSMKLTFRPLGPPLESTNFERVYIPRDDG